MAPRRMDSVSLRRSALMPDTSRLHPTQITSYQAIQTNSLTSLSEIRALALLRAASLQLSEFRCIPTGRRFLSKTGNRQSAPTADLWPLVLEWSTITTDRISTSMSAIPAPELRQDANRAQR